MSGIYRSERGEREVRARYREVLGRWPSANQQLHVPTREGETFIVASGRAEAPPVILLQGSGGNSALWMSSVRAWAEHFRVHAVDTIGEPGLSAPSRPPLASDAHALWMDDVMDALALPRAAMVGVSLGGWLALDYATRRPERVERAVVVCPSGVGRQKASFVFKALPLLLLGARGRRRVMRMLAGATPPDELRLDPQVAQLVSCTQTQFRPRRERVPIFDDDTLKRLTMPLMLVAGGRDPMLDSAETKQRLERTASRLTVRFLPERGHLVGDQTTAILEFLRSR